MHLLFRYGMFPLTEGTADGVPYGFFVCYFFHVTTCHADTNHYMLGSDTAHRPVLSRRTRLHSATLTLEAGTFFAIRLYRVIPPFVIFLLPSVCYKQLTGERTSSSLWVRSVT